MRKPHTQDRGVGWTIASDGGGSTAEEMQDKHHDTDDQQGVNDASKDVKREEPEQPENDENCSY
jgi:hypothetical protein